MTRHALIVGAGPGLGSALARKFAAAGYTLSLAVRSPGRLSPLVDEIGAQAFAVDAAEADSVGDLFATLDRLGRTPELVIYNAGAATRGPVAALDLKAVRASLSVNGWGALVVAHEAAKRMQPAGHGVMLFTGATAGVKGFARSAPMAMGKFALRGLCQSLSRELAPKGIHVAHFVLDGVILNPARGAPYDNAETTLDPDQIAATYLSIAQQHKSAWTYEVELRPSVEQF